jgi:HEAT repeat protein/energy-coupling factor transporter ATP-binding protein EcfA2
MADLIDFQRYLQSICHHYDQWWTLYTLTDVEGKEKANSQKKKGVAPFDFRLMVRAVQPKRPEILGQEKVEKTERLPLLKGLRKSMTEAKHVLLIGRPGSGKSTALARLLLEEAEQIKENKGQESKEQRKIPVLVELRYYQTSVIDLIRDFFRRHELWIETHQVETLLSANQLLLLIDGLNELPSEVARQEITKLRNYRKTTMIFTTRDLSLGGDFGIEKQLEMQPLTQTQRQEFIRVYLLEQADQMWWQLKDRLRKIAETPLLLWMLCELFKAGEEIPQNLSEVFRAFTRAYEISSIRKHEVAALKGDVQALSDRRLWFPALKHLASVMMQVERPVDFRPVIFKGDAEQEFKALFRDEPHPAKVARDCLDDLLKYHLLHIKSGDEIEFRHQLIQEYYAAEWLLRQLPNLGDEQLKYYFLNYLKWTEPIALMMERLDDPGQASRVVKLALKVDLMLGARLAGKVKIKFQGQSIRLISELQLPQKVKRHLLSSTRSEAIVPVLCEILASDDTDAHLGAIYALGKIGSANAITILQNSLEHQNLCVRLVAVVTARVIDSELSTSVLLQALRNDNPSVRDLAASMLSQTCNRRETRTLLQKMLEQGELVHQESVVNALERLDERNEDAHPEPSSPLIILDAALLFSDALEDIDTKLRDLTFLQALESEDSSVRLRAIDKSGQSGDPELLSRLQDLLLEKAGENPSGNLLLAISGIQRRCGYYNYDIARSSLPPPVQSVVSDVSARLYIASVGEFTVVSEKPQITFNQEKATIGVNYAAEGSKQEFAQYNNASEQNFEVLLTDFKRFINDLQQEYPNVTDDTAHQIIDVKAKEIQSAQPSRWQNFLSLKRLWNGVKKGSLKAGEHFAEQTPWGKGAIGFLEGVTDDVQ